MTSTHEDLLGLPLPPALKLLEGRGIREAQVQWTQAPGPAREEGTPRVVALREQGKLVIAARFLDGMPHG